MNPSRLRENIGVYCLPGIRTSLPGARLTFKSHKSIFTVDAAYCLYSEEQHSGTMSVVLFLKSWAQWFHPEQRCSHSQQTLNALEDAKHCQMTFVFSPLSLDSEACVTESWSVQSAEVKYGSNRTTDMVNIVHVILIVLETTY